MLALIVISPSAFEAVLITPLSPSIPKFSPPCTILTVLSSARNSTLPIALATISSALCRLNVTASEFESTVKLTPGPPITVSVSLSASATTCPTLDPAF